MCVMAFNNNLQRETSRGERDRAKKREKRTERGREEGREEWREGGRERFVREKIIYSLVNAS